MIVNHLPEKALGSKHEKEIHDELQRTPIQQ
jgi:hypothetical protein